MCLGTVAKTKGMVRLRHTVLMETSTHLVSWEHTVEVYTPNDANAHYKQTREAYTYGGGSGDAATGS